jgi:hypothetical protein
MAFYLVSYFIVLFKIIILYLFTGKPIQISLPAGNFVYPSVWVKIVDIPLEANFGNDSAEPFKFDSKKCPRLDLESN